MANAPEETRKGIRASFDAAAARWKGIWDKRARRKREEFSTAAAEFASQYPGAFVMLADPSTDVIVMAHHNIIVPLRYTDAKTGKRQHIVADALNYRKGAEGERAVDQFLLAVDSGVVKIADGLYSRRRKSIPGKVAARLGLTKPHPAADPEKSST